MSGSAVRDLLMPYAAAVLHHSGIVKEDWAAIDWNKVNWLKQIGLKPWYA